MEIRQREVGRPRIADELPNVQRLIVDLRTLVGLRSRTAVRDRHLPALLALLPAEAANDRDLRFHALQDLVGEALAAMTDPAHRRAATALFGLGDGRWRPLTQRGAEAAATFGLGWDGYRRRRPSTGSSLLEETIEELARGLVPPTAAPADAPTAEPTTRETPLATPIVIEELVAEPLVDGQRAVAAPRSGRTNRPVLLVAGTAAAVAALVALVLTATRSDPDEPRQPAAEPAACGVLRQDIGDLPPAADVGLRQWAAPFEAAATDLPAASVRCASSIESRGDQVFQRISGDGDPGVAALVGAADGPPAVVALDAFEFPAFRDHHLEQASPTARLGTPTRRADRDGLRVVEFTDGVLVREELGSPPVAVLQNTWRRWPELLRVVEFTDGVLVREELGSPPVAVLQNTWRRWTELGGLDGPAGRPLTNRYGVPDVGDVQEFTGGDIVVPFDGSVVRWEPRSVQEQQLPDAHRGAVLTARGGGGSWLIDRAGVRHWITTETAYACATRSLGAPAIADVSAAAIAALPAGVPYQC